MCDTFIALNDKLSSRVVGCPEQYRACDSVILLGDKDQSFLLAAVVPILETAGAKKKWRCASLRVR